MLLQRKLRQGVANNGFISGFGKPCLGKSGESREGLGVPAAMLFR